MNTKIFTSSANHFCDLWTNLCSSRILKFQISLSSFLQMAQKANFILAVRATLITSTADHSECCSTRRIFLQMQFCPMATRTHLINSRNYAATFTGFGMKCLILLRQWDVENFGGHAVNWMNCVPSV